MSPKLPRITSSELLRALERGGWRASRQSGSHVILRRADRPVVVVVPFHKGKTLPVGTLSSVLDEAGLTADDLRRLL